MDITVYLPDGIGKRAKRADLPFSRMLRSAVLEEFSRRSAVARREDRMTVQELDVENDHAYTARFIGLEVAEMKDGAIYLHEDGRVFWHSEKRLTLEEIEDPVEELRELLDHEAYVEAVTAIGLKPVVEL